MFKSGFRKNLLQHIKPPLTKDFFFAPKLSPSFLVKQNSIISRNYASFPPIQYRPPTPPVEQYKRFQHNRKVPFYLSKRVWVFVGTGTVLFGGYYVTHLEKVPISGRSRFMSITPRQEEGK